MDMKTTKEKWYVVLKWEGPDNVMCEEVLGVLAKTKREATKAVYLVNGPGMYSAYEARFTK